MNRRKVLFYNLFTLFLFNLNIILTFSIIYSILDYLHVGPIVDHFSTPFHQEQWFDRFTRSFYFSAITFMSVGYGDITPFGWSKAIAMIEAMIGYILPAVLVVNYILFPTTSLLRLVNHSTHEKQRDQT